MAKIKENKKENKKVDLPTEAVDQKKAKRLARMEALKNRPAVQRPNSKQIDVIETENGVVKNFGYALRGKGVLVTSVAMDKEGNVTSTSVTLVEGPYTVKTKKGHGIIRPVKGMTTELELDADNEPADAEEDED